MTSRRRSASSPRRAFAASRPSARAVASVSAFTFSSGTPAASFAAAQYRRVTIAMSAILAHSDPSQRRPRVLAIPGSMCLAEVAADRRRRLLSNVLLLTAAPDSASDILPSLSLLSHATRVAPPWPNAVLGRPAAPMPAPTGVGFAGSARSADSAAPDIILVDARRDLVRV